MQWSGPREGKNLCVFLSGSFVSLLGPWWPILNPSGLSYRYVVTAFYPFTLTTTIILPESPIPTRKEIRRVLFVKCILCACWCQGSHLATVAECLKREDELLSEKLLQRDPMNWGFFFILVRYGSRTSSGRTKKTKTQAGGLELRGLLFSFLFF